MTGTRPEFDVYDRLRKAREHAGMTQSELADAMGVDRRTVSNNEGRRVEPRPILIRMWAHVTGVDEQWIVAGGDEPDASQ